MTFILKALGAILAFVLEILPVHGRNWIDEEVKPRRSEGSGDLL
jgi:hypothetical protein